MQLLKNTLTVYQNNSFNLLLQYKDSYGSVDLQGFSVNVIVKNKRDCLNNDNQSIINKTFTIDNTEEAQNGLFYVNLTKEDLNIQSTDKDREYIFQVQLSKDDEQFVVLQANFVVLNNIKKG